MSKTKNWVTMALSGLLSMKPDPGVKIDTQPITKKKESFKISKRKLKKMKGKKARKNKGEK